MCGRFSLTVGDRDIEDEFKVKIGFDRHPRYNIAPTQEVLVLLDDGTERRIETFRWGLIPHWAPDPKIGNKLINARAETIFEKPSFRSAAKERRCLILADGFFEWAKTEKEKGKIPLYVRLKSGKPFGFAGLWESWQSPEGEEVKSCAIVTTEPNELMLSIHNRMPVIVQKKHETIWLDPTIKDPQELIGVLQPYPPEEMEAFPVSKLVNSPANDRPECIVPVKR